MTTSSYEHFNGVHGQAPTFARDEKRVGWLVVLAVVCGLPLGLGIAYAFRSAAPTANVLTPVHDTSIERSYTVSDYGPKLHTATSVASVEARAESGASASASSADSSRGVSPASRSVAPRQSIAPAWIARTNAATAALNLEQLREVGEQKWVAEPAPPLDPRKVAETNAATRELVAESVDDVGASANPNP